METGELELSREQIAARIEEGARRRLGLSANQMVQLFRDGALKDCGSIADLLSLAHLLEKDDPLFVPA